MQYADTDRNIHSYEQVYQCFQSAETGSVQIVYVVLVGGRAVPAAVAARDMRLVRDAEVAKELGAVVTTKAERMYSRFVVKLLILN